MDTESLNQIRQIVTEATEAVESRLGLRIGNLQQQTESLESRLGERIDGLQQQTESLESGLREEIQEARRHSGVLAEHLQHQLALVAEHQQAFRQYVEDFRSETKAETKETRALLRLSYHQLQEPTAPSPP